MSVYSSIVKELLKNKEFRIWVEGVAKRFFKDFKKTKREKQIAAFDSLSLGIKDVSYPGTAATYSRLYLVHLILASIVSSVELMGKGIVLSKFYMRERYLYLPRIASIGGIQKEYVHPFREFPSNSRAFGFRVDSSINAVKLYKFYVLDPLSGDKMPSDALDRLRSEIDHFHESPTSEGELEYMIEQFPNLGIKSERVSVLCYFTKNGIIALSDDKFISDDEETDIHLYFGEIQSTRDSISQEWRKFLNLKSVKQTPLPE